MNTRLIALCVACCTGAGFSAGAQNTAFTYQGALVAEGSQASGLFDFRFTLFDGASAGNSVAGPLTNSSVAVSNGLFTCTLDFGMVFPGPGRWLEVGVRTNGGGVFFVMTPRQALTPTPYAITAANVVSNGLASGAYSAAITLSNPSNSFTGDGAGLTGLNASQLTTGSVPAAALGNAWKIAGNGGTAPGANFIGTTDNQPLELRANRQRVLVLRPDPGTNGSPNIVAGSPLNAVANGVVGATIGGGGSSNYSGQVAMNQALGTFNTIGGGVGNTSGSGGFDVFQATVGGGAFNIASGISSTIGGGSANLADNNDAAIAGGFQNRADFRAAVGGGQLNTADGAFGSIGGGYANNIQSNTAFARIGGGIGNQVQGNSSEYGSTISGGGNNSIAPGYVADGYSTSAFSSIGGGLGNGIGSNSVFATIGGGRANALMAGAVESTIGGGFVNQILDNSTNSTIGGGKNNQIQGSTATIAGGAFNQAHESSSAIGGGIQNTIEPEATYGVIAGGNANSVQRGAFSSFIGGGRLNGIGATAYASVLAGGMQNSIQTNSSWSVVAGGFNNVIQTNAALSVIGGGQNNLIGGGFANAVIANVIAGGNNNATAAGVFGNSIGGGFQNTIAGIYGTIPGGYQNYVGGTYSVAMGNRAKANYSGDFVWADSQPADFNAIQDNQFLVRAQRGVGINTVAPQQDLSVNGGMVVDQGNNNAGPLNNGLPAGAGLTFGSSSGEGIASQRTGGPLQYSLAFYTAFGNRLVILNSGLVGIGTTTPVDLLDVNGNAGKPGGGSWSTFSDVRLKKNIRPLTNVVDRLLSLRGVTFEYKEPERIHELPGEQIGMIAQEVETVFPGWVYTAADGYKRLSYHGFEALAVEAVRELRTENERKVALLQKANEETTKALAEQKELNARLESRITALEQAISRIAGTKADLADTDLDGR